MLCPYCANPIVMLLTTVGKTYQCIEEDHEFIHYKEVPDNWCILHVKTDLFICERFIAYNNAPNHPGHFIDFPKPISFEEANIILRKFIKLHAFS